MMRKITDEDRQRMLKDAQTIVQGQSVQTGIDRNARMIFVELSMPYGYKARAWFDFPAFTELVMGMLADHESLRQLVEHD